MMVSLEVGTIQDSRLVSTIVILTIFTVCGITSLTASIFIFNKYNLDPTASYRSRQTELLETAEQQKKLRSDITAVLCVVKMKKQAKIGDQHCAQHGVGEDVLATTELDGGTDTSSSRAELERALPGSTDAGLK
jgi:hypothetical protein